MDPGSLGAPCDYLFFHPISLRCAMGAGSGRTAVAMEVRWLGRPCMRGIGVLLVEVFPQCWKELGFAYTVQDDGCAVCVSVCS
jgi:hypothetical protein